MPSANATATREDNTSNRMSASRRKHDAVTHALRKWVEMLTLAQWDVFERPAGPYMFRRP